MSLPQTEAESIAMAGRILDAAHAGLQAFTAVTEQAVGKLSLIESVLALEVAAKTLEKAASAQIGPMFKAGSDDRVAGLRVTLVNELSEILKDEFEVKPRGNETQEVLDAIALFGDQCGAGCECEEAEFTGVSQSTIDEAERICDRRSEVRRQLEAGEITREQARSEFPETF